MEFGRKALWATAAGVTIAVTGVAIAANGDAPDSTVAAAAPVTEAISELNTTTTEPTTTTAEPTTTTTAPTTTTAAPTTTTAPPPPPTTAPAPAPTTTAPPPPPPPPPSTVANRSTSCESYMYQQINNARANAGVHGLQFDTGIQYIALDWSDHLSSTQVLAHNPNYGSQIASVRNYRTAGENVGRGYHQDTLFQAFMNSSGHRANILSTAYSHVTVGCVTDGGGQYWVTQNFWG